MKKEKWITEVMNSSKYPGFDVQNHLQQLKEIKSKQHSLHVSVNWLWPFAAIWLISTIFATKQLNHKNPHSENLKASEVAKNFIQVESYQIY